MSAYIRKCDMAMGLLSCWPRCVSSPKLGLLATVAHFFDPGMKTARHLSGLHRLNNIMSAGLGSSVCLDFSDCAFLAGRNEDAVVAQAFASHRSCKAPFSCTVGMFHVALLR